MTVKYIDPASLVDAKFLGVPYKLGGQDPAEGMDCIALGIWYMREALGIEIAYDDDKGPIMENWYVTSPGRFVDAILEYGTIVRFHELRKYDVVLFFGEESVMRYPTCLGVMVGDRHFLGASHNKPSFVSMLSKGWRDRFWGAVRLKAVVEKLG